MQVLYALAEWRGKSAVTGVGTSGIAASKVAHLLACVEQPEIYLIATDAAHGVLGFLGAQDIIIFISSGGNS
ncbi:phosphosugar isomerase, partial [Yersinia pestis]|nr:phosphosugar isomerase [Yersinia pestis]